MEEKEWKDIEGYEGYYQISNYGRVKSLARTITRRNGGTLSYDEIILKHRLILGYPNVNLHRDGKQKTYRIHRLVGKYFCPNSGDDYVVNHENGVKDNNYYWNLKWCSSEYNTEHARVRGLQKDNISGLLAYNKSRERPLIIRYGGDMIFYAKSAPEAASWLITEFNVEVKHDTLRRKIARVAQDNETTYTKYLGFSFHYMYMIRLKKPVTTISLVAK